MLYFQIAAFVISILLGIARERPLLNLASPTSVNQAALKAEQISRMEIQWVHRRTDPYWSYHSDPSGRYWCRVNPQGIREYCENPQYTN